MTFDHSQLRNLSPEARKFLWDFDHRKQEAAVNKPVEPVSITKGWECEKGDRFDYPLREGVGRCPVCRTIKIHLRDEPGATESDDPKPLKPLPMRDLSDRPAPPKANAAWFDEESRKLAQTEAAKGD